MPLDEKSGNNIISITNKSGNQDHQHYAVLFLKFVLLCATENIYLLPSYSLRFGSTATTFVIG